MQLDIDPWLFSAFATADITHLRTSLAMRLREFQVRERGLDLLAADQLRPHGLSFCGETRRLRAPARLPPRRKSALPRSALPIVFRLRLRLPSAAGLDLTASSGRCDRGRSASARTHRTCGRSCLPVTLTGMCFCQFVTPRRSGRRQTAVGSSSAGSQMRMISLRPEMRARFPPFFKR